MERLLVLRLESLGVAAEAWLNGVPLARTSAARPVVTLPIHEYTRAGGNELELVIEPPAPGAAPVPEPRISDGRCAASVQLLLPRIGQVAHPDNARTLARIDWAPPQDEITELPATLRQLADLRISFPRWRWLDAPVVAQPAEVLGAAAAYLQGLVLGLQRGDPEPLLLASRMRLEELAQAYQRSLADDVGRLRLQIQQWHAKQPLKPPMPRADTLRLRPLAGGRLLECLGADGGPALHCELAEGRRVEWPLRLALIEGRFYVLR